MKLFRILVLAALLAALFVLVGVVSADCPDDDPRCTILPPVSQEVGSAKSEGSMASGAADTTGLTPLDQVLPMPPPPLAVSLTEESSSPLFDTLSLPLRQQDPSDPTCGAQALGMALDGLGGSAPSSSSLWNFLEGQGMTYDFGTGVEELAHAAQSFGYAGSLPFHNASLEDLMTELEAGRPVVVSLGANGEGQPGHFVTLTGVSPDGAWVSYNDPILGKVTISREDFMALWGAQGNSGVRVAVEPLVTSEGELNITPWVAMAAGLMALVSTTPMVLGRKGIGGRLDPGGASGGSAGDPPYPAPSGYYWTRKLVTKYKTVWEQDGWTYENRSVPRYEKQRVQVGTTTVYDKIPRYKTVRVQDGWDTVKRVVPKMVKKTVKVGTMTVYDKIPQYKTVRVQDGWKTVYDRVAQYKTVRYVKYYRTTKQRVKRYRYVRGRRVFAGYRYITKRTPVYGTKKKFNGYKKVSKRVPNYVDKRVPDGFKVVTTQVPKYETRMVQNGWTTVYDRVPHMVERQVPDGWEVVRQVVPKYEWRDVRVGWTTEKQRVPNMVQVRKPDGYDIQWVLKKSKTTPPSPTPSPDRDPPPPSDTPSPETDEPSAESSTPESIPTPPYDVEAEPNPTPTPQGTPYPTTEPTVPTLPEDWWKLIPSTSVTSSEVDTPWLQLGIIELGKHSSVKSGTETNPLLTLTPQKFSFNLGASKIAVGWEGNKVEVGLSTPSKDYSLEGSESTVSYQHSATASITYDWWNTTIRSEYNTIDLSVSTSDDEAGFDGSVTQGVYFEEKPVQIAAAQAVVGVIVAVAALYPPALAAIGEALRQWGTNPLTP